MEKKLLVVLGVIAVILLALSLFMTYETPKDENLNGITSSSTAAINTECLDPASAYRKISGGECIPVYEDPACFASGRVEIRC